MKRDWLLPFGFKRVGWVILVPAVLLGLAIWLNGLNGLPEWICPEDSSAGRLLHTEMADRVFNNIALIGVWIGALFVACSRERIEDEMISRIRLNALLAALYVQMGLMVVIALAVYDFAYLEVMVANLVALPLIFLTIQRLMLRRIRKEAGDEE